MSDSHDNPMGTDGFEFVEYTAPDPQLLRTLFERLGFPAVALHRSKNVTLHRQGGINFIINAEPESFAQAFARAHGPSACAMAFRVRDAARAFRRALELGAKPGPLSAGPMELNIPSLEAPDSSVRVEGLRRRGMASQATRDTYYARVGARGGSHREPLDELRKRRILIDGNPEKGEGLVLQVFTRNVVGPIFFEVIER